MKPNWLKNKLSVLWFYRPWNRVQFFIFVNSVQRFHDVECSVLRTWVMVPMLTVYARLHPEAEIDWLTCDQRKP